jgi:hypothetical protein
MGSHAIGYYSVEVDLIGLGAWTPTKALEFRSRARAADEEQGVVLLMSGRSQNGVCLRGFLLKYCTEGRYFGNLTLHWRTVSREALSPYDSRWLRCQARVVVCARSGALIQSGASADSI